MDNLAGPVRGELKYASPHAEDVSQHGIGL
jgi:hypothetical protein